ncbi:protein GLE1-like isoform X1 [Salvia splendens]|uniref:protein GLE1-like isoform X1 n=1 Tax=Salvia splendens TaxID=180675 RepID=UPI001C279011|nr:protein GLE1-like isoform X1 [Salvia splendens]
MGFVELGLPCPRNVNGITADPQPDWSFDQLLSEINSIEKKLNSNLDFPSPFTKNEPRDLKASKDKRGFVMRVSDYETDYADADSDSEADADNSLVASGRRFACDELYMSDDSEDDVSLGMQCHQLMDRAGLAEAAVYELNDEHRLNVTEAVRSKVYDLETELVKENEKFVSLTTTIHKNRELQQERVRKLDLQYQRTLAEDLDNHLTVVQRDHEHISQLEERRIRDDMARAEAKRREKAIQEEKIRQERIKAEEEQARLKSEKAERDKAAALEAEIKAAEEAAAKQASASDAAPNAGKDSKEAPGPSSSTFDVKKGTQSSAVKNIIRASQNALELEKRRQQIYEELSTKVNPLNQDYQSLGRTIGRLIRTISATIENIRTRAEEIMKLISSPQYPQPISIKLFAEKIVSNCTNQRSPNAIFASSRVVVLVTSKIPLAMDILVAELNRVCIYTVPKHISYSKEAFGTRDDYFKAIGYKEVDGKLEGLDEYLERLSSYMKLYGALVQTEVGGCQNLHGMKEGWSWLARFLNTIPSNLFTAIALDSFLVMAGYGMYCRYRNQFEKLLSVIGRDFVNALQEGGGESRSAKVSKVKMSLRNYIESKQYKKEPEGLQLRDRLDSNELY